MTSRAKVLVALFTLGFVFAACGLPAGADAQHRLGDESTVSAPTQPPDGPDDPDAPDTFTPWYPAFRNPLPELPPTMSPLRVACTDAPHAGFPDRIDRPPSQAL